MKKIYVILLNLGYWLSFALLLTLLYVATQFNGVGVPSSKNLSIIVVAYVLIPSILSFYASYFFIFCLFVNKVSKIKLLFYVNAILIITSLIAVLSISIYFTVDTANGAFLEVAIVSFLLNSFNALIGFILHSFISWFTDLRDKEALTEKTKLLELEMLKLKLDPHFLFNTINNIDVLIESDSDKAADYIIKLSSILRFYLYKTSDSLINLEDEIKYIREYIDLQKIRTSNPDFVKLLITGNAEGRQIAPMIFIPFIENAFKHSHNKKVNAIAIDLNIGPNEVSFKCRNLVNPKYTMGGQLRGIGNELVESRLKLIYDERYSLDVYRTESEYIIDLKVPI